MESCTAGVVVFVVATVIVSPTLVINTCQFRLFFLRPIQEAVGTGEGEGGHVRRQGRVGPPSHLRHEGHGGGQERAESSVGLSEVAYSIGVLVGVPGGDERVRF